MGKLRIPTMILGFAFPHGAPAVGNGDVVPQAVVVLNIERYTFEDGAVIGSDVSIVLGKCVIPFGDESILFRHQGLAHKAFGAIDALCANLA